MTSSKFLDYEIALLLAKYGKSALLTALAKHLQLTLEELDALLQEVPKIKAEVRPKSRPPTDDLLDRLLKENPNKAQSLRTLSSRFWNKTFLPELRDVRRFFEQHDQSLAGLRTRADALPRLLKILAGLDAGELESLSQAQPDTGYSSLGVISEEILRGTR